MGYQLLTQKIGDRKHVIAYASRTLNAAEKNYSVIEKECLAIVWGIDKMRPYLEGYQFVVLTDHQSLKWLHSIKSPIGRLARWSLFLQQYDFEIKYRKGALNKIAGALSRNPIPWTDSEKTEFDCTPDICAIEADVDCAWYKNKKQQVEQHPENNYPDFTVRDGNFYRHFWDSNNIELELVDPWKLCVSKPHRLRVLQENHDHRIEL